MLFMTAYGQRCYLTKILFMTGLTAKDAIYDRFYGQRCCLLQLMDNDANYDKPYGQKCYL